MNRVQVIEAFADGEQVRMQALNLHASFTAAYWYYPPEQKRILATSRLHVIDVKHQVVYSWLEVERMMFFECLKRLENGKSIGFRQAQALLATGYIDVSQNITTKGFELIAEIDKPSQTIELPFIKSSTKLYP